jgi:16S rRNA (guanine527-N7)-methyltransferase
MGRGDILYRGLAALGLEPDGPLAEALRRYLSEIERFNPTLGLVGAGIGAAGEELVVKHILDSLAPIGIIRSLLGDSLRPRIADLGTGAGLPGLPLALALPQASVHLVDRMTRRTDFLRGALELLRVGNAEVVESQVERLRGAYDLVTFRAFRPFEPKLFKRVFALCETNGRVLAYKGRLERARSELPAIEGLYSSAEVLRVEVPFLDEERCVVVMRPRSASPA